MVWLSRLRAFSFVQNAICRLFYAYGEKNSRREREIVPVPAARFMPPNKGVCGCWGRAPAAGFGGRVFFSQKTMIWGMEI